MKGFIFISNYRSQQKLLNIKPKFIQKYRRKRENVDLQSLRKVS
jgi:hypothetical protein